MNFTHEEMLETYKAVSYTRVYEKLMEDKSISGEIPGFMHVCLGDEALVAAIVTERGPKDWLTPHNVRDLALFSMIMGPRPAYAETKNRMNGPNKGIAGAGHIYSKEKRIGPCSALLGSQTGALTGIALAMKLLHEDACAICGIGDGTINEGMVMEALNLAATKKLPLMLYIQNNGYAMSMSVKEHSAVDLSDRVRGFGIPCTVMDGEDVLGVKAAMRECLATARSGQPCVLEVQTKRWTGHFVGDPQRYRDREEIKSAREFDPYKKYRAFLVENDYFTMDELDTIDKENRAIINDAMEYGVSDECPLVTKEFVCVENAKQLYA